MQTGGEGNSWTPPHCRWTTFASSSSGQLLAGPFCGQLLGDFGAEVIKVEDPANGDPMRQWGREKPYGKSLWWPVVARNKKSVTADLRTEEGQDLVRRLHRSRPTS